MGTVAHIHAAAPGGPRYEPSQTREERRGIGNALWLCATCARLIDSDVAAHPAELLRRWKGDAEQEARARIGKRATTLDETNAAERSRLTGQLDVLVRQVNALGSTLQAAFTRRLDLRPSPLVVAAITRDATVARILGSIGTRPWLAIHGEVAIGKTHLAALLARARGESIWIRTRGVDVPEARARVEEAILLRGSNFPPTVVLDDLPAVRDELVDALVHLLDAVGTSALVVSTSNHRLGPRVREHMPHDRVLEEECPGFTDEEAATLLRAHGAASLSDKAIVFLNALAHHHPALLTAIGWYLKARGWVLNEDALGALFAREHLSEVNNETVRALTESVASDASRSLLYRLTLVRGAFDADLAGKLGAVSPPVSLIRERLVDLDGLWIQRQNDDRYIASPLVTSLPSSLVDEPTRIACCRILAVHGIGGRVTPRALVDAAVYHVQARAFDDAAQLLSFGLASFALEEGEVSAGDLLVLWWGTPLPSEMSPDASISLRCAQIAAGLRANKNIDALVQDLSARLAGSETTWGAVMGAAVAFLGLVRARARTAFALLRAALSNFDRARLPNGQPLSATAPVRLELLAWVVAPELRAEEQIAAWVELVVSLPQSSLGVKDGWVSFHEASLTVVDRIWQREVDKPSEDRDWHAVEVQLLSIRSAAIRGNQPFLVAVATRAAMVVLAEYEDRTVEALALAEETLPRLRDDRRAEYLVRECEGRQALYRGELQAALIALDAALVTLGDDTAGGLEVLETLNSAARAVSRTSLGRAVGYARRARDVAAAVGDAGQQLELARACGELAIACEHVGDRAEAYAALSAGAEALLASSRTSDFWKRTAAIFAHAAGYIGRMMTTGKPPPAVEGGTYARPEQGVFYTASKEAKRVLRPQAMASVCVMLAEFAGALGADGEALHWGKRALEEADADPTGEAPQFVALALPHMIRASLVDLPTLADALVTSVNAARARTDHADIFVLGLSLVPLASEILRLSVCAAAAVAVCEHASQLCADVAGRVGGSALWEAAARVFRAAASKDGSVSDLVHLANELARSNLDGVQLIAALVASVDDRRKLRAVAQAHLSVLGVLEGPNLAHIRTRVMSNLEKYWREMVTVAPFQFAHPAALKGALAATQGNDTVENASLVLHAVADDLGARR